MFELVNQINDKLNMFIWGEYTLVLLVGTGVLFSIFTAFFQVTHFPLWWSCTAGTILPGKNKKIKKEKTSITQFQALCTALAGTVGTGNIAGVATAIVAGGPGAVFWMWVSAFFGMMTSFAEKTLGIYYRRKNKNGEWCGGAMYYLCDGLGMKKGCKKLGMTLSKIFCIFTILASLGIGNLAQINTISSNVCATVDSLIAKYNPAATLSSVSIFGVEVKLLMLFIGLLLFALASLVILGGLKRIAAVTEKMVPLMVLLFLAGAFIVIFLNVSKLGDVFNSIFTFAFGKEAIAGAITGKIAQKTIVIGCKRGVFSNEAGMGSSVIVHSNSNVTEPVVQGMWGMFEVFIDTIIMCTVTALVILCSGIIELSSGLVLTNTVDTALTSEAFATVFGDFGNVFVTIMIFLFAFSSVIGWSYYGTKAWEYLFGKKGMECYKLFFVLLIILGATFPENYIRLPWEISDTFNGLMMIPNLIGILSLSGTVNNIFKNYYARKVKGKKIRPMLSAFEDIQIMQEINCL